MSFSGGHVEFVLVVVAVGVVAVIVVLVFRDRFDPARREKEGLRHLKKMVDDAKADERKDNRG